MVCGALPPSGASLDAGNGQAAAARALLGDEGVVTAARGGLLQPVVCKSFPKTVQQRIHKSKMGI